MKYIEVNTDDLKYNINVVKEILKNNYPEKNIRNHCSC